MVKVMEFRWKCESCGRENTFTESVCPDCAVGLRPSVLILTFPGGECFTVDESSDGIVGRDTIPGITDRIQMSRHQMRFFRRTKGGTARWWCFNLSRWQQLIIYGKTLPCGKEMMLPPSGKCIIQVGDVEISCEII